MNYLDCVVGQMPFKPLDVLNLLTFIAENKM